MWDQDTISFTGHRGVVAFATDTAADTRVLTLRLEPTSTYEPMQGPGSSVTLRYVVAGWQGAEMTTRAVDSEPEVVR